MNKSKYNKQYEVPIGIWYDESKLLNFLEIDKKKLIFVGHLLDYMGIDLIIKAMPILKKKVKGVRLEIIGGGPEEKKLKNLVCKLKLGKDVKFYGWVKNRDILENIMSDGAIGMATFNTKILDDKVKNADPGKIKDYMSVGLPVIVTSAVSTAQKIEKAKAGLVVNYDVNDLVLKIEKLLKNEKTLEEYRKNAHTYVKKFDYGYIFSKNLKRVLEK